MIDDITGIGSSFTIDPAAQVTATSTGSGIDIRDYVGRIGIRVTCPIATAGTSPTLIVKIQDSPDNSTFTDIAGAVFTTATGAVAVDEERAIDADAQARYIRSVATVGGSNTPTFAYAVTGYGAKKTG